MQCSVCSEYAPTKYYEYNRNVGMIVLRKRYFIQGEMCEKCSSKNFNEFFFKNLYMGWWGLISMLVTPYFAGSNLVYRYTDVREKFYITLLSVLIGIVIFILFGMLMSFI